MPLGDAARGGWWCSPARLRGAGVRVDLAYGGRGLKGAMKAADRSGARFTLVLGDRDLDAGTVGVKDLASGEQESVALDAVVDAWSRAWRGSVRGPAEPFDTSNANAGGRDRERNVGPGALGRAARRCR